MNREAETWQRGKTMPKRQLDNENSLKHLLMDIVRSKNSHSEPFSRLETIAWQRN